MTQLNMLVQKNNVFSHIEIFTNFVGQTENNKILLSKLSFYGMVV